MCSAYESACKSEYARLLEIMEKAMPTERAKPVLGSRIMATPYIGARENSPIPGTIDYVHDTHMWYRVCFDIGIKESYQWGETKCQTI